MGDYRICETLKSTTSGVIIANNVVANRYSLGRRIAQGTGIEVYETQYNGQKAVIKLSKYIQSKYRVCEIIHQIDCKYVMKLYDFGVDKDLIYEVYPYYHQGNLEGEKCSQTELEKIVISVNEALNTLHKKSIIHGDVKPANIYWADNCEYVTLGDFDISVIFGVDDFESCNECTLEYYPVNGHVYKKDVQSDYASFGMTILDLYVGRVHFAGKNNAEIEQEWKNGILITENIVPRFKELIDNLTHKIPEYRYTYKEVKLWIEGQVNIPRTIDRIQPKAKTNVEPLIVAIEGGNVERASDLRELAIKLSNRWDAARKRFFGTADKSVRLIEFISQFDKEKAVVVKKLISTEEPDVVISKMISMFGSSDSIVYKGKEYGSIEAVIETLDEYVVDSDFVEYIRNGLMDTYLINNKKYKIKENIDKLSELACDDGELLYYLIIKAFRADKSIKIGEIIIEDVNALVKYVAKYGISKELEHINAKYIYSWLMINGYVDYVHKMKEISNKYE